MIQTPDGQPLEPIFDWYQLTAETEPRLVFELLQPLGFTDPFIDVKPVLPGYAFSKLSGGVGGSVRVHFGGRNGDDHGPNIQGTGPRSPDVADLFRNARMPHKVSRADVRLDFLGDYDRCRAMFIERCNTAGVATSDAGSSPESLMQHGRTVYGGARSSFYRPTMYQKGLQLGEGYPVDFVRLEHRYTPTKSADKSSLAQMTPEQMIGCRPIARDLTKNIAELAVSPYKLTSLPKEKTPYYWMLRQYRGVLLEMLEDNGSWPAVGQQIGFDLMEMEEPANVH
jgi:hypothetical protein